MQVKVIEAVTSKGLEKKINQFIEEQQNSIVDIKIASSFGAMTALIQYEK